MHFTNKHTPTHSNLGTIFAIKQKTQLWCCFADLPAATDLPKISLHSDFCLLISTIFLHYFHVATRLA
jgi:hypothetical protein